MVVASIEAALGGFLVMLTVLNRQSLRPVLTNLSSFTAAAAFTFFRLFMMTSGSEAYALTQQQQQQKPDVEVDEPPPPPPLK
ncbi:MAG: hypothetical protein ACRD4L_00215, partial [Pyrinomonadaceae bacterium]